MDDNQSKVSGGRESIIMDIKGVFVHVEMVAVAESIITRIGGRKGVGSADVEWFQPEKQCDLFAEVDSSSFLHM